MWFCHRRLKDKKEQQWVQQVKPLVGHADGIGGKRNHRKAVGERSREYCAEGHASVANLLFQQSSTGNFHLLLVMVNLFSCNEGTSQMSGKRRWEEQMKKEMEKQDRERRKEEKENDADRQRMEERFQREERLKWKGERIYAERAYQGKPEVAEREETKRRAAQREARQQNKRPAMERASSTRFAKRNPWS
nr:homeobox-DDT domain protein RLT1-like [Ipomoea batatas]